MGAGPDPGGVPCRPRPVGGVRRFPPTPASPGSFFCGFFTRPKAGVNRSSYVSSGSRYHRRLVVDVIDGEDETVRDFFTGEEVFED